MFVCSFKRQRHVLRVGGSLVKELFRKRITSSIAVADGNCARGIRARGAKGYDVLHSGACSKTGVSVW